jgi:cell division septum initiation protein DivIVA
LLSKMPTKLSDEIINAAIDGFQVQKKRLEQQIAELRAMLPGGSVETGSTIDGAASKRRKFSTAALRRIREAQRQRWARVRGEKTAGTKSAKPKRRISAQGLKNIIAATKRRWAVRRLEATKGKKTPLKKAAKRVAA